jgi:hypothetical protein
MQKISYIGNGTTTEFNFNFPFYTNTDIIVTKNNQTVSDYIIIGTSAGLNADIPYTCGKVVFNHAPSETDYITIYRKIPLTRVVDYQPTEKINPTNLNQDINYIIEVLKDMNDDLENFNTKYNDFINNPSVQDLLTNINYIKQLVNNDEMMSVKKFYSYNTNCIANIPQDIKITLSSGTITLKSGSKLYIPNGNNTFNTVITSSDLSITPSGFSTSSNRMIVYYQNGTIGVLDVYLPYVYSGTTAPTTFDNNGRAFWYDTTNNIIKKTSDGGTTWTNGYAFPIALVDIINGTGVSTIKKIFNGVGFIGRTLYVLPGVKALHSNGFNNDGTLKNNIVTVSSVLTHTGGISDNLGQIILNKGGTSCQFASLTTSWKYDSIRNIFYWSNNNDTNWINIGKYFYDSTECYITNFDINTILS